MVTREERIKELRKELLAFSGPIVKSPHYDELAQLLVSDCVVGSLFEIGDKNAN